MPSAFTERERERIAGKLLESGFRLFTTQGLRKTSLDDLVAPAGIAKSTFYRFFGSKEELYVEQMYRQVPELRAGILGRSGWRRPGAECPRWRHGRPSGRRRRR